MVSRYTVARNTNCTRIKKYGYFYKTARVRVILNLKKHLLLTLTKRTGSELAERDKG